MILQTSACEYTKDLESESLSVSVYESVLRGPLPRRNTASANGVIHVVSLAVTMTDYAQLTLPQTHRGASSGAFPCVLAMEAGGVLGNHRGPPPPYAILSSAGGASEIEWPFSPSFT